MGSLKARSRRSILARRRAEDAENDIEGVDRWGENHWTPDDRCELPSGIRKTILVYIPSASKRTIRPSLSFYTWGEMTSQNLWSRHVRHFVGITWHNVWR